MSFFDIFSKRGNNQSDESALAKSNNPNTIVDPNSIDNAIEKRLQSIQLADCTKIPFEAIAALGTGFSELIPAFRTITQTMSIGGVGYIPINMGPDDVLKKMAGKDVYYGAHFTPDGTSVMTKWVKAGTQTVTSTGVVPVDTMTIIMAAMLVNIERKLDNIQNVQQSILSFLEQDKQAEMQADLNVLSDILNGYKYNWESDQYKTNHHIKVLDIKRTAEKNTIFYQTQIATSIENLPGIYLEQVVNDAVKKITSLFHNYRMALYLFAYSSYLEVILLRNFREEYLNQVAVKVQEYNEHYKKQFVQCRDMIKSYASGSVEKQVLGGIGNASKFLGKLIASSPILSQGPVDEWLQESGEKLLQDNENGAEKTAARFDVEAEIGSEMFVDSIKNIEKICARTTGILFDEEAIYLTT